MLVKGIAVISLWIYFKFHYKQRYIFNRHSSIVWILYGKLLIKTDASCTCLIIICQLIWFAGPRRKYVSCFTYIITTCLSFCLYYIHYVNCSILLIPRCIGQLSAIFFYHYGKIRPQKHDTIIPYSRRGWRFLAPHHCSVHRRNFHCPLAGRAPVTSWWIWFVAIFSRSHCIYDKTIEWQLSHSTLFLHYFYIKLYSFYHKFAHSLTNIYPDDFKIFLSAYHL